MGRALTGRRSSCELSPQKSSLVTDKIFYRKSKLPLRTSVTAVPASTPLVFVGRLECLCVACLGSETLLTQKLLLQSLVSFLLYATAETASRCTYSFTPCHFAKAASASRCILFQIHPSSILLFFPVFRQFSV